MSQFRNLAFEGGGVKGIAYAGALQVLEQKNVLPDIRRVAGTSAGAITAALVAAGYSGPELEEIVLHQMDFTKFEDGSFLGRFGPAGDVVQFFKYRGMHSGDYFLGWITELLQAKGKVTFGDLKDPTAEAPRIYKLRVIASDLSARSMLVLPDDAQQLGQDPDELRIAEAVRMSMSIPVFFEPVRIGDHEIVDGGLLSNFPVWLFDSPPGTPPAFPTFGMLLVAPGQAAPLLPPSQVPGQVPKIGSDIDFLKAIAETMMEAHDRFYVDQANYARTIPIPTLGVQTTEFGISPARAQALFSSGKDATAKFLASWDFEQYKTRFRSGTLTGRRETVARGAPPEQPA